jgi:osmoprotectant transport system substrate-binding protein
VRRAALAVVLLLVLAGCGGDDESRPAAATSDGEAPVLRIGTKDFTEQYVLGELYAQALRAKGFPVELKPDVGSTEITHQALTGGALDMYPEYVGVLLSEVANLRRRPTDPEAAYQIARDFERGRGFDLLGMTPFSDQNALAVTPAFARRHDVQSIEDLAKLPGRLRIGAPPEFRTRFEGLIGLEQRYGMTRARAVPLAIGSQYDALDDGRVDAAAVFTTDGMLADRRYVILEDPRGVFATQRVAPVISRKALAAHGPKLRAAIDAVSAKLTATSMREMNAAVDLEGRKPAEVAGAFLQAERLK